MKKLNILLILGLTLLLVSCATVKTSDVKGKTVIVEIPGASKDELFVKASTWMVETFNSSKSVTQYSDKEAGVIKGKYIISFFILVMLHVLRREHHRRQPHKQ